MQIFVRIETEGRRDIGEIKKIGIHGDAIASPHPSPMSGLEVRHFRLSAGAK